MLDQAKNHPYQQQIEFIDIGNLIPNDPDSNDIMQSDTSHSGLASNYLCNQQDPQESNDDADSSFEYVASHSLVTMAQSDDLFESRCAYQPQECSPSHIYQPLGFDAGSNLTNLSTSSHSNACLQSVEQQFPHINLQEDNISDGFDDLTGNNNDKITLESRQNSLFDRHSDSRELYSSYESNSNEHMANDFGINLMQYISKRNERERSRVRNVNDAFENLKSILPLELSQLGKRMSKVEILRSAIEYIKGLENILEHPN